MHCRDHVKLDGIKLVHVESNKNQHARGQSRDPRSKLQDNEGAGVSGGYRSKIG